MDITRFVVVGILASAVSAAAFADKTTTIKEPDGSTTTVHTDSHGTQTTTAGGSVYSSGGDRHKEQVDKSTSQGGTITSGPGK